MYLQRYTCMHPMSCKVQKYLSCLQIYGNIKDIYVEYLWLCEYRYLGMYVTRVYMYMYTYDSIYMHICHICKYECTHVHVCMYVCMYVYIIRIE
jgi:hypothetical protein